jgi:hypothetical protein
VVKAENRNKRANQTNGIDFALHDTDNDVLLFDPDAVLEEASIKVESYRRWHYELVVSTESLRAADIALEDVLLA